MNIPDPKFKSGDRVELSPYGPEHEYVVDGLLAYYPNVKSWHYLLRGESPAVVEGVMRLVPAKPKFAVGQVIIISASDHAAYSHADRIKLGYVTEQGFVYNLLNWHGAFAERDLRALTELEATGR